VVSLKGVSAASLKTVRRLFAFAALAVCARAECRLPDVPPDALARLSPAQLLDSGHYLRAERVLEPLAKSPDLEVRSAARISWMLSRSKAALGKLDEAMSLAEAALAAEPSNAAYHVQVAAVAGRLAEKAGLLKRLSYVRRARQELDAAAALDPKNTDTQWGLMMYYYAAPALLGGDKSKALQIGRQLASAVPDLGSYYQGRLAVEMKDAESAEAFYKQSMGENPLLFETVSSLAMYYIRTKPDQAKAERWACQAVHADPTRGDAWALLARVYTMCGCWTEAIAIAERSEAIDPDDLVPWFAIAEAALERGRQLETAAAALRKYLSRPTEGNQPVEAQARLHLGTALAGLGDRAEAMRELQAAMDLDSSLDAARAELKRLSSLEKTR
jgi:tetratricopeptide (TPR) repeat protein